LDDGDIRRALEKPGSTGADSKEYTLLTDKAREFKGELLNVLLDDLGTDHEMVRALLL
jgi:hypothetical protein